MRNLFYCDTSYQLMTIINIMSEFKYQEADLVIYHNFYGSFDLIRRVRERGLFSNIYEVAAERQSVIVEVKDMVFARSHLKKLGVKFHHYDCFYAASLDTVIALNLYSVINYSKFILIDDGIGSYYSNILGNDYMSFKRRMILKLSHPRKKIFFAESLYVYSPELCESTASEKKKKISFQFSEDMEYVFHYKSNHIYSGKIIILEQPCSFRELDDKRYELDRKFNHVLETKKLLGRVIVRLHPRMNKSNIGNCYDIIRNQWELECKYQIDDNNILIAIHSTSIFQPTIMFGKCPKMILLFKLYRDALSEDEYRRIDYFIKKFVSIYQNANVLIPKSFDEFEKMLNGI